MKVLPKITKMNCSRLAQLTENYTIVNFNNSSDIALAYQESENFSFDTLTDLLECNAYATALLYLNENCILSDKYGNLLKESNIEDFYNDCEELLTKNIKIVEEAGILLTNINGYKIFEGEGYILRGNGKKKIRESFNERGEIDLADITLDYLKNRKYDAQIIGMVKCPNCGNIFDREENTYEEEKTDVEPYSTIDEPYNEKTITYTDKMIKCPYCGDSDNEEDYAWAWVDDLYDAPNAEELVPGIHGLNEDAEGTQCADIAPKLDQKSGVTDAKPKKEKKYYDILLSGLDEHEDLKVNKGFIKNLDGYYQRGNYILVKEGDKYLAVHKDKVLTESKIQFTTKDIQTYLRPVNAAAAFTIKNTAKAVTFELASTGTLENDNTAILYEIVLGKTNGADLIGICDEIKSSLSSKLVNDYKISNITVAPAHKGNTVINIGLFTSNEPIEV